MRRPRRFWGWVVLGLMVVSLVGVMPAAAQGKTLVWQRWDVHLDSFDPVANRFTVVETHDIQFLTGTFTFGYRAIPLDRVERLENIQVFENGSPLQPACNQSLGTYCVRNVDGEAEITYYFFRMAQGENRVFEIHYDVVGGLRTYGDGDQLDWFAVGADHAFSILNSTVTVQMSPETTPREGQDPIAAYGAPVTMLQNGSLITFSATGPIPASQGLEVRVQYPHSLQNRTADWQAAFDRDATLRPYLDLFLVAIALLLTVLGPLVIYYLWYRRGRDPIVGVVPDYLAEPPSDLPPAVVGTLIDEEADLQDVTSTLLDLARRGYLVIEEDRSRGFLGFGASSTFTFKRTDQPAEGLRRFENIMLGKVFGRSDTAELESLKNKFYTAIPRMQEALYKEVVRQGFFTASPQKIRQRWIGAGVVVVVVAGIVGAIILSEFATTLQSLICVPLALGWVGVIMLIAASRMPAKTEQGAIEAARWCAFRDYLRNIQHYTDLEQATDQFNDYLPYAVAFGLERAWVSTFSRVPGTPIPYWYYPRYMGGPWDRGYYRGGPIVDMRNPDIRSQLARPGASLDGLAGGAFSGLNQMSTGLFTMLDSASSTFSSQPSSSSGGGFSGGFSGGGGGGGGGSAGFG